MFFESNVCVTLRIHSIDFFNRFVLNDFMFNLMKFFSLLAILISFDTNSLEKFDAFDAVSVKQKLVQDSIKYTDIDYP